MSYHQNNEHQTLGKVIQKIQSHNLTCLITDSGTPAISDPGFLLVRECIKENIEVECLPGPTAFVPALVVSGLPAEKFIFEGFLPHKKGRETRIKKIALEDKTVILYESPHRLLKTLEQLANFCGNERECAVVREISKLHEEVFRGTLEQARLWAEQSSPKGEFVLLVSPVKD
jgi:16S rRNA (cytidine1402-2'-O)-methyltransferase